MKYRSITCLLFISAYLYIVIMMIHSVNKKNRYRVLYSHVSEHKQNEQYSLHIYTFPANVIDTVLFRDTGASDIFGKLTLNDLLLIIGFLSLMSVDLFPSAKGSQNSTCFFLRGVSSVLSVGMEALTSGADEFFRSSRAFSLSRRVRSFLRCSMSFWLWSLTSFCLN